MSNDEIEILDKVEHLMKSEAKEYNALDKEVEKWMISLGFSSRIDAEIPNYILDFSQFVEPNELIKKVAKDCESWDLLDDITCISPEVAKLFYLKFREKDEPDRDSE